MFSKQSRLQQRGNKQEQDIGKSFNNFTIHGKVNSALRLLAT